MFSKPTDNLPESSSLSATDSPPAEKAVPDVPLTTRSVRIRKDMLNPDGTARPWSDSWPILRDSLQQSQLRPVVGDNLSNLTEVTPKSRMFSREWLESAFARILDGDREIRERYDNCSTAFVTLTASGYKFGTHYAPIDHYYDLDRSWTVPAEQIPGRESDKHPIYQHLNGSGFEYEYVRIDGVHDGQKQISSVSNNQYYAHRHILIYLDKVITADVLKNVLYPIVDKHIKYCPSASREQHPYENAIRWDNDPSEGLKPIGKEDRARGLVTPAARDIASHLPDVRSGSTADRQLASMMYAVNKRSWSDSTGFREAYRDRYETQTGRVHPARYESEGDGTFLGWQGDHGFVPVESAKEAEDFMTISKEIPKFY